MMPQQVPFYSPAPASGASPGYGQPGFFNASPASQGQGAVQVGLPVFASTAQQAFANGGDAVVGNIPFSANSQQNHFDQGQQNSFVQGVPSNNGFAAPPDSHLPGYRQGRCPSPPPSSFPPGFEPGLNNSVAMGVPSQPGPNAKGIGEPVAHPNEQQVSFQHRHMHADSHEYQHQEQYQHQPEQIKFESQRSYQDQHHENQQQRHSKQHQHPRDHQHRQQQPQGHQQQHEFQCHQQQPQRHHQQPLPHPHQYQPQHPQPQPQHRHHGQSPLQEPDHHQPQHPQPQPQHRHHHQSHLQELDHDQPQHNQYPQQAHSQIQMQAQPYQNAYPRSHSHPQPQLQLQTYPKPMQLQTQQEPHLQTQPQPVQVQSWTQIHQQAQSAVQQVQFIPAPFPSTLHGNPPNIQVGIENGVAIGLPVMPTPSHIDSAAPQNFTQIQQPSQAWQPVYPTSSLSQPPPANRDVEDYSKTEQQTNTLREHTQGMPPAKVESEAYVEGTKPLHAQGTGPSVHSKHHLSSRGSHPSFLGNNHRQWNSPPKLQTPAWGNGRNSHHGFQHHRNVHGKFHTNGSFSGGEERHSNGQQVSPLQRRANSRGKPFSRDVQRSDMQPMRCGPCDRTFTTSEILATHVKTHVKCGEEGCTFEASAKIVKEHKVMQHGKIEVQATSRGRKALALRSLEDKEDIRRWREERKRSYPTSANILRKAEERRRREAEGEIADEESEKRRQRILDIVAKQKQLGFQAPEIPSHYFKAHRYDRRPRKMIRDETDMAEDTKGKSDCNVKREGLIGTKRAAEDMEISQDAEHDKKEKVGDLKNGEPSHSDVGHQRRGYQSKYAHRQERRKRHQNHNGHMAHPPRPPTLLSKLLHDDVEQEMSCLLQCCRFIVNNSFFSQDPSPAGLKHFEWIREAETESASGPAASVGPSPASVIDSKAWPKLEGEGVRVSSDSAISTSVKDYVSGVKFDASTTRGETHAVSGDAPLLHAKGFGAGRETEDAPHGAPAVAIGEAVCSVDNSVPAGKRMHVSTDLPDTDVEAGDVASGHSESVIEDEDMSQYTIFDENGADSGCCYD